MDMPNEVILAKLGAAFHLHRKLAHSAARAAEAVDYLKEKGTLEGLPAVPKIEQKGKSEVTTEEAEKSFNPYTVLRAGCGGAGVGQLAGMAASIPLLGYLGPKFKTQQDLTKQELRALRKNMRVPSSVRVEKIPWNRRLLGPHYDFQTHTVHTDNPRSYSSAHEFGHATGPLTFKRLRRPYIAGYRVGMSLLPGLAAGLNAANQQQFLRDKEEGGMGSKILSGLDVASKAGTGVVLAEEGQATARALRAIHAVQGKAGLLRGAKLLLPAYGTYLAQALGHHFIAPSVAKWVVRNDS